MTKHIDGWTVEPGRWAETGPRDRPGWSLWPDGAEGRLADGTEATVAWTPAVLAEVLPSEPMAEALRARGWTVEEPEPPGPLSAYEVEVTITRAAWERLGSPREGRTVTVQQDDGRGSIHVTHVRLEYVKVDGDSVTLAGRRVVPR